jgi:peptidyl-prolyl cis-trans isomerase C
MRMLQRRCWAVLGLTLSYVPAFAQTPQSAAPSPPPPPASVAPAQAAPPAPANVPANAVAASVNGQPILESVVQRSLQRVPADKHSEARPKILDFLIDQTLLDQYLLEQKITVAPAEIEKAVADMKLEAEKQKKDFSKELESMKVTEAELREHIAADMRWYKFAEQRADDKILKELFESKKYLFDGSMVRARHILLSPPANDPKAAEQAVAQLQAVKQDITKQVTDGLAQLPANTDNLAREKKRQTLLEEAFAAQAKAKSACPSKEKGGDVEWFQAIGFMVEPFSRAAFALKPFELSEPVKTPFGYHLILVTDRKAGREVKYEEVKEMVKDHYFNSLHNQIIGAARANAKISVTGAN